MFCPECGKPMQTDDAFCSFCGFKKKTEMASPIQQPVQSPYPATQTTAPAAGPSAASYQPAGPSVGRSGKKGKGCLIALAVLVLIAGVALFFAYRIFWGPPKDLGIRYTQADFDSAMQKVELTVDFEGMDSDELTDFIRENRGEKLAIDDYDWQFSGYRQREIELTPAEATAFINEVAPLFTWFDRVQANILPDGTPEGSYQVDFAKVKAELIPDVADQIPAAISSFLPNRFNLYTKGRYEIRDNRIIVPEKLDSLNVGAVSMHPVIGDLEASDRNMVFGYVERVYNMIPDLMINYLRVNERGNFECSVYAPTHVEVRRKPGR